MGQRTVVSLFSGGGGLDYGFEAAGYETRVALDADADSCNSLRASRRWPVLEGDISTFPTSRILRAAGLRRGEVDVLIGGPPCQPFSKSGFWRADGSGRLADPRAKTLGAFMRVVEEAQPKVLLLENVQGINYAKLDEGFRLLLRSIQKINRKTGSNYRPTYQVLNAADFGVPQMRDRLFLIASRDGTEFKFPVPSHGGADGLVPYRTAWDALVDLPDEASSDLACSGKWARLLPSIPEGSNYLWHTARGGGLPIFGWRCRYWTFLLKLAKNRPSWTIQANPGPSCGPFHWNNRKLSTREMCRLQTFPDDAEVIGTVWSARRQVGNAVPSLLAEVLAREIAFQILGERRSSWQPKLLPAAHVPPRPERRRPVPFEYRSLVGDHPPHPGEGQGPLAIRPRLGPS
ncbi:MAG: DNA cytosine methyltransferase [Minicystis sp.]